MAGARMHVLITVNAAWNIWNFRRSLVTSLIGEGHRVTILAPADDTVAALEEAGCRFIPLDMDVRGLNPLADLSLALRFVTIFRRERPDVVLGFTIKNNIFGALASRMMGVPFLPNVTGLGTAFLSGGALQRMAETLYASAFRKLPVVFFQNDDDRDMFVQRGLVRADQARVLPGSGIDLTRFAAAPMPDDTPGGPVFLMVGRLLRDKGVIEFVDAARQIRAEGGKARFELLGPAEAENRTAINLAEVDRWVGEGIVTYHGAQADVRPFLRRASCVVLPSYREGAPRTLIEASAMARPVIATDVPGCRAVVDADTTGFFCEARNSQSLAAAMWRFLRLASQERAAMAAAARGKMEREFDDRFVLAAYREAIKAAVCKG